jgi:glycerophosphoryl diester phosphodiesterase
MSPLYQGSTPVLFGKKALAGAVSLALGVLAATELAAAELVGRAVLPAASFAEGPTSGQQLGAGPINGQAVPFVNKQPIQGFSAVLRNRDGSYWAMADNGFGRLENSADFNLRMYRIRPRFETATSRGDGRIRVLNHIELHDPDRKIPFTITNHFTRRRVLTGADFDLESVQRAPDGTLWFGDEFGPFLLHTDARGKVLEAPIPLPDFGKPGQELRSPQNPFYEEASAVRIMNAVRAHARRHGNDMVPVFSPHHVNLRYAERRNPDGSLVHPASDPNLHYARGTNTPGGLKPAASDIFDVRSIQAAGYPIVTWTISDTPRINELLRVGVNGIISDRPDVLLAAVRSFDANNDGIPGDYLDADGLIDISKFDAQSHRGGRNLRPENTFPAMEVGLDNLMTTLEADIGITKDHTPVLAHAPYIYAHTCRRVDGVEYTQATEVLIKDWTVAQIQSTFICDKVFRGPSQVNDRALSPVAVAFAASRGLIDPYIMPTVNQLFDFVDFYVDYYKNGDGKTHPEARLRWMNAERARLNIETKVNPRSDADVRHGLIHKDRTLSPDLFADILAGTIINRDMQNRVTVQSFDFRTLLRVQSLYPSIRTVYLFGDFPIFAGTGDGTNLQDEHGANTPWLAGMYWPYRDTTLTMPARVRRSGGFEGMAIVPGENKLLPLLEMPLIGDPANLLKIHEFDLTSKQYTGVSYQYLLEPRGTAIGDFIMNGEKHGLIIERDGSQGDLTGFKAVYEIALGAPGQPVVKTQVADLLNIADPNGISLPVEPGTVGLGDPFAFPFVTIESVVRLSRDRIGILNDNNFPFSIGRHVGTRRPDDNEFIILKLDRPLNMD